MRKNNKKINKSTKLSYEKAHEICGGLAHHLINIYFEGVDRKKKSAKEMVNECPNFLKDCWLIVTGRAFEIMEEVQNRKKGK